MFKQVCPDAEPTALANAYLSTLQWVIHSRIKEPDKRESGSPIERFVQKLEKFELSLGKALSSATHLN